MEEFEPPAPGPFGLPVRHLPLPARLVGGQPEVTGPEHLGDLPGGGFAFAWGDRTFVYDRLGLRLKETESDV